jgi:hypothetical protein
MKGAIGSGRPEAAVKNPKRRAAGRKPGRESQQRNRMIDSEPRANGKRKFYFTRRTGAEAFLCDGRFFRVPREPWK